MIQLYAIKFVSDLWQICGFLHVLRFHPSNKTDLHELTEILLKVALNTITLTLYCCNLKHYPYSEANQSSILPVKSLVEESDNKHV